MFICDLHEERAYIEYMERLKSKNRLSRKRALSPWTDQMRQREILTVLRDRARQGMEKQDSRSLIKKKTSPSRYFSSHRIAVYTCIIGDFDELSIPTCTPNNIDYFVISDISSKEPGPWKFLPITDIDGNLSELTPTEQNRWVKMHPHLLFPEYEYSIYLDGNITPISDVTEFIHSIGPFSIATHQHYYRHCAYEEGEAVLLRQKDTVERINQHLLFLQAQKFPKDYGLADCSVIARKHHDPVCFQLMDQWWKEFMTHSRRDQISFPYVLFKNNVRIEEVTTLGSNRLYNDALHSSEHLGKKCTIVYSS